MKEFKEAWLKKAKESRPVVRKWMENAAQDPGKMKKFKKALEDHSKANGKQGAIDWAKLLELLLPLLLSLFKKD